MSGRYQNYQRYSPNGTVVTNLAQLPTADQLDEMNRKWKEEQKAKFLAFPVEQREAFLMMRRARAVEEGMSQYGSLFGVAINGYRTSQGGLASWPPTGTRHDEHRLQ
jgi:hypothetical protein